ncbi:MAG: hypothetical protein JWN98_1779 [Abditibacteriota bacterium]|nr:hypothetical protein [Abditibacteriota bacterium]
MRAQQAEMQRQIDELKRIVGTGPKTVAPEALPQVAPNDAPAAVPPLVDDAPHEVVNANSAENGVSAEPADQAGANRNYLLLPDISFSAQAKGRYSSDRRDENRRRASLSEAEIAIQSDVYPGVRAEAYIVAEPGEDVPFGLEQGFLDFLGIRKGLNIRVGRDFTPFGRTARQHTHSWLYARQLIPIRNLVAGEALTGDGVLFSYLLPTKGRLFAQAHLGAYNGLEASEISSNPFGQDLPSGTGAGFNDRFYLGRLLLAHPVGGNGELELGTSYARGRSAVDDDTGANLATGRVDLLGVDASYRRFFSGSRRLLLRSEYFRYTPSRALQSVVSRTNGYYGLTNFRFDKFNDLGLLYENSGFPQGTGQRESGLSLIYTKRFTEQFYVRLHGTRGRRPGLGSYNEAQLQFTWGLGPHTHSLE